MPSHERLKRQYSQGVPMRRICHQYGVNMTELRSILGMPPRAKRQSSPLTREERQAIADLRSEGYSDAAIEAVFGLDVVTIT